MKHFKLMLHSFEQCPVRDENASESNRRFTVTIKPKMKLGFYTWHFFSIFLLNSFSANVQLTIIKVFISEKLEKTWGDVLFIMNVKGNWFYNFSR